MYLGYKTYEELVLDFQAFLFKNKNLKNSKKSLKFQMSIIGQKEAR